MMDLTTVLPCSRALDNDTAAASTGAVFDALVGVWAARKSLHTMTNQFTRGTELVSLRSMPPMLLSFE